MADPAPQTGPLCGRRDELDALARLVRDARWVCVTGAVGMGKTRLVQEHVAQRSPSAGPVVYVSGLEGPGRHPADAPPPDLVVLDGVPEGAEGREATVRAWLDAFPAARVLVTSRARTGASDEVTLVLGPLAADAGRALFVARAAAAVPGFAPRDDAESAAVDRIVQLVDGLPLAIELCAAQTLVMRPVRLLAHLQSAAGRLDAALPGMSLRGAIAGAHALLPAEAAAVFARCAVFDGGFDFDAAVAVAGADLNTLRTLCERSLVHATDARDGRRFSLFGPLRDFGRDQLDDEDPAWSRHLAHHLRWAAGGAPHADLATNLLGAAQRAAGHGDLATARSALLAAGESVRAHGPVKNAVTLLTAVREPGADGRAALLIAQLHRLDGRLDEAAAGLAALLPEEGGAEAAVWLERANLVRQLGRADEADALYRAAADADPASGDVLERWGGHLFEQGATDEARGLLERAEAAYAAASDARGKARVAHSLGMFAQEAGDLEQARARFAAAEDAHRALGDARFAAIARFDRGAADLEAGAPRTAQATLEQAVTALDQIGDVRQAALGRALCGVCALFAGDRDEARALLDRAAAEVGPTWDRAFIRAVALHRAWLDEGDPDRTGPAASDEERYALRLFAQEKDPRTLRVRDAGGTFMFGTGPRQTVKSAAGQALLSALVAAHQHRPAQVLSKDALLSAAWPDEKLQPRAAQNRLQVALSALRKAGLGDALVRTDDGYGLDPAVIARF